jgi:ATP-dependent RNA helicase RhlE
MIAADGFDFSKPYEPRGEIPANAESPPSRPPARHPRKLVAVLLGGLGRTEDR